MQTIDRLFFGTAILLGLGGMTLGIYMGASQDFSLTPVHAHLNLVGWVSMALFGIAYRTGLARRDIWATVHYGIATAGGLLLPAGIYVITTGGNAAVVGIGSLCTFASMLLFGLNFLRARGD